MRDDEPDEPSEGAGPPALEAGSDADAPAASTSARGGLARTLLVGVAVVAAFFSGLVGVRVFTAADEPAAGRAQQAAEDTDRLRDRVAPTERAPLPERSLLGFSRAGLPAEEADAAPVRLADYRGAPLLVNFWATWCAPCVKEMPEFQAFWEAHGGQIALLGVNVQDAPANAATFAEELGITYDLATDPAGELFAEVRGFGMPTTLFVDAGGTIVYRHTGPLDAAELTALVQRHLGADLDGA